MKIITGTVVLLAGLYICIRSRDVGSRLQRYYRNYPFVSNAGQRQTQFWNGFAIFIGAACVMAGVLAVTSA